jgi:hypothetical protein
VEWIKEGLIFVPEAQASWIGTHAALPAILDVDGRDRLYFSSRDRDGRSHIGFLDVDPDDPRRMVGISSSSIIDPGALGAFDDAGVTSSCAVARDGRVYLFYTGWSLGVSVPFYLNVGVAVSDDNGCTFRRLSRGPLLDRDAVDPFLTASPWVIIENDLWRMWYVSGTGWLRGRPVARHRYHIKYAESRDGLRWERSGLVCIDYQAPDEYAFGRPCVLRDGERYRMWYSFRGDRYRIGYAESDDGLNWVRQDSASGIEPSDAGWDAEMVTYPIVVRRSGRWQMLYNGNDYGRTGIGLARSV